MSVVKSPPGYSPALGIAHIQELNFQWNTHVVEDITEWQMVRMHESKLREHTFTVEQNFRHERED